MVLTVDGVPRTVGPLSPFAFSGAAVTDCRLVAGRVRNLNVMTRRERARAQVRIVTVAAEPAESADSVLEAECAEGETLLVMATTEGVVVGGPNGRETALGRLDCVRREGRGVLTLRGDGVVAEIRITGMP
ncbi:hypothetical protein AT728_27085 [Streptomyces silvensis]|uniref:Uncharacterized protein n=2 Tax=Streptomyces silvensis TaxID=1765722 RepID=A0A0W7WX80_9ACTN|nr:hypothetical protein AT728_27085 [Streptomyces silvensis]